MNLPTASKLELLQIPPEQLPIDRSGAAVILQDAGVRYRIPSERFHSFKEYTIRRLQRKVSMRDFWALRNVNLTVFQSEVFGIVGSNGAGKSTLLKLLARVLKPTEGRVIVRGVVAPLLEFGAGFHGELTGRENIYLNGALLGYTRQQMDEKLQRIIDFAELWDFIDAPLRTYSSGMWVRLGFATATDERPDILIIDEVLAVGDEAFQHKSAARIQEFRDQGATILLVSHMMSTIESMCHRAAWLDHGKILAVGKPDEVIDAYRRGVTPIS